MPVRNGPPTAVFPLVDGRAGQFGRYAPAERTRVYEMLATSPGTPNNHFIRSHDRCRTARPSLPSTTGLRELKLPWIHIAGRSGAMSPPRPERGSKHEIEGRDRGGRQLCEGVFQAVKRRVSRVPSQGFVSRSSTVTKARVPLESVATQW